VGGVIVLRLWMGNVQKRSTTFVKIFSSMDEQLEMWVGWLCCVCGWVTYKKGQPRLQM